jgi:hypothetical protein
LRCTVKSRTREEQKSSRNPASRIEDAKKDLDERGRGRHIHARYQALSGAQAQRARE